MSPWLNSVISPSKIHYLVHPSPLLLSGDYAWSLCHSPVTLIQLSGRKTHSPEYPESHLGKEDKMSSRRRGSGLCPPHQTASQSVLLPTFPPRRATPRVQLFLPASACQLPFGSDHPRNPRLESVIGGSAHLSGGERSPLYSFQVSNNRSPQPHPPTIPIRPITDLLPLVARITRLPTILSALGRRLREKFQEGNELPLTGLVSHIHGH